MAPQCCKSKLYAVYKQYATPSSASWKSSSGSNSNGLVIIPEPQKATNSCSYSNSELLVETASTSGNSR